MDIVCVSYRHVVQGRGPWFDNNGNLPGLLGKGEQTSPQRESETANIAVSFCHVTSVCFHLYKGQKVRVELANMFSISEKEKPTQIT